MEYYNQVVSWLNPFPQLEMSWKWTVESCKNGQK